MVESERSSDKVRPDWTDSYTFWSKWEDAEESQQSSGINDGKVRNGTMDHSASFMGHDHDHSEERKLLEYSESEKMSFCERHRLKGNYLFLESLFPKAAEQYQLALSYYEYCFPDDDETQANLDILRRACLCNISLCYYRMGQWRMALTSASQVIQEDENNAKALFRRAQAYRALDEYGNAESDIAKAFVLCPNDRAIQKEMQALQLQKKRSYIAEKGIAHNMLHDHSHCHSDVKLESLPTVKQQEKISVSAGPIDPQYFFDIFALSMPLEPRIPEELKK